MATIYKHAKVHANSDYVELELEYDHYEQEFEITVKQNDEDGELVYYHSFGYDYLDEELKNLKKYGMSDGLINDILEHAKSVVDEYKR